MAQSSVITNIESKTKVNKFFSLKSLFFFVIWMVLSHIFSGNVLSILYIPYMIFSMLMCMYFLMPSVYNKGRNNIESIYIMLFADNSLYKPYYADDEGEEDEWKIRKRKR